MKRCSFLLTVVAVLGMAAPVMAYDDGAEGYDYYDGYDDACCSCDCGCEYCGCYYDDYYYDDCEDCYTSDEGYYYSDEYDNCYDEYGYDGYDCCCDCGCEYCYCGYYSYDDYDWVPDTVWEYMDAYGTIMIVDLEDQHVYCCVDGEIIADANCVSGDSYSSPTPTGLYSVWCKRSDFYMMDAYYSAYAVFFNEGIAIHDADAWRSEYGGTIYKWGGSHGCINTPRWFAEIVYENTEIGTPVYVF